MNKVGVWNELYRPQELSEVINLPQQLPSLVNDNLPHLLLHGVPGIGKTTTARIIIKQLDAECLELNASDERGIDTIREKVKSFAASMSMNGKIKIVFLDEGDGLTPQAQESLRNIIEKYHKFCRFILSANYINKVIEPLKSRFSLVEFKDPQQEDIESMCIGILLEQGVKYEMETVRKIIDFCYPDIRKTINTLQTSVFEGSLNDNLIQRQSDMTTKLYGLIQTREFQEIRKLLVNETIDYSQMILALEDKIYNDETLSPAIKSKAIIEIGHSNRMINMVAIPRIELEYLVVKILELTKDE